jgi:outer membrane protein assembly factor BamB
MAVRIIAAGLVLYLSAAQGATPVLTRSFDNGRTGVNLSENNFSPASIANRQLKRFKSLDIPDDPRVEAQPLYVPDLAMNDGRMHNVVFVCSMANTVYAFDTDAPEGADLIWKVPVGVPFSPPLDPRHPPHGTTIDMFGINIKWGILSTPVIDMDADGGPAMYLVNWVANQANRPALFLHALRLKDGQEFKPSLAVTATMTNAAGKTVRLSPDQKQRAALLLVPLRGQQKVLYVATAGGENPGDPHGWMVAYNIDAWKMIDALVATPSTFGGGMWMASQGPSADADGNVYAMTANGGFTRDRNGHIQDFIGKTDFAESIVKLALVPSPAGRKLQVVDWFAPFRDSARKFQDQDLGSGAPVVPPGMNIVLGAGKDGVLYVLDRNNMGKAVGDFSKLKAPAIFFTFFPGPEFSPTGEIDFGGKTHHLHGSPIFWNSPDQGPTLFAWGENECLRSWTINTAGTTITFVAKSAEVASAAQANPSRKGEGGMPGGMLTMSAKGNQSHTGVVWATAPIDDNANQRVVEGIIRAYDATELDTNNNKDGTRRLKLLWDNLRLPAGDARRRFAFSKFCTPFVADGKLYVTTYGPWPDQRAHGRIDIYTLN